MQRKTFLKTLAPLLVATPLTAAYMKLTELEKTTSQLYHSQKMPVLFLGHGSPMNAIEENEFVRGFREIALTIPKPRAILVISAHWETRGTQVTAMENPRTIHDFGGFPKELFDVQYPAPGSPELAKETKNMISKTEIQLDEKWGLDHGSWSVIKHLYPNADVPVVQMSLDYTQAPQYHYDLAQQLSDFRNKGILIIGSGNMVHNLGLVAWQRLNESFAFDWALEADSKMKEYIQNDNHKPLLEYSKQGSAFKLAVPSPEHYMPLLYTLALKEKTDTIQLFNDKPIAGALTMTSVKIG